jgi:hypothetical protein
LVRDKGVVQLRVTTGTEVFRGSNICVGSRAVGGAEGSRVRWPCPASGIAESSVTPGVVEHGVGGPLALHEHSEPRKDNHSTADVHAAEAEEAAAAAKAAVAAAGHDKAAESTRARPRDGGKESGCLRGSLSWLEGIQRSHQAALRGAVRFSLVFPGAGP